MLLSKNNNFIPSIAAYNASKEIWYKSNKLYKLISEIKKILEFNFHELKG